MASYRIQVASGAKLLAVFGALRQSPVAGHVTTRVVCTSSTSFKFGEPPSQTKPCNSTASNLVWYGVYTEGLTKYEISYSPMF